MSYNSKYKGAEVDAALDLAKTSLQEHQDISGLATKDELARKVDKVDGKQLSTEDFTTALKQKLDGLANYDDTTISQAIEKLREDFDTLVSGDTTAAIKTFNEVIAFLDGLEDTESLDAIIASIEQQIAAKYTKPSTGIPKSDLANAVQTSLSKADTALQSYTEQYRGTVTGVKMNGTTKNPSSGVVDLGTVITEHQDLSGYQPKLVSGTNVKTINGESILGEGDITIESGSGGSGDYLPLTGGTIDGDLTITGVINGAYGTYLDLDKYGLYYITSNGTINVTSNGSGTKFLSDDGTYKEISGEGDNYLPLTGGTITGDVTITKGDGGMGNLIVAQTVRAHEFKGVFAPNGNYSLQGSKDGFDIYDKNSDLAGCFVFNGDGTQFLSNNGKYKEITVPTKVSDLENDMEYATRLQIEDKLNKPFVLDVYDMSDVGGIALTDEQIAEIKHRGDVSIQIAQDSPPIKSTISEYPFFYFLLNIGQILATYIIEVDEETKTAYVEHSVQMPSNGTVTSITAGEGLEGGTITDSGTISLPSVVDEGNVSITPMHNYLLAIGNTPTNTSMSSVSNNVTLPSVLSFDKYGRLTSKTTASKSVKILTFNEATPSLKGLMSTSDKVKLDGVRAMVNHGTSDTTFALTPNVYHKWGTVTSLNLTLAAASDSTLYNEYLFEFVSGTTATTLSLPDTVSWVSEPNIEAGKTYQCSIVNNIGIIVGV